MDAAYKSKKRTYNSCTSLKPDASLQLFTPAIKRQRGGDTAGPHHSAKVSAKHSTSQHMLLKYAKGLEPASKPQSCPQNTSPFPGCESPGSACVAMQALSKDAAAKYKQLPPKYAVLCDIFGKLQTVHAVQAARHQRCTLQNSQHTLENHCGRRFTISHLAQLKYIFPEALQLEWVWSKSGTTAREPQLLITLHNSVTPQPEATLAASQQPASREPASAASGSAQMREGFISRVFAHLLAQAQPSVNNAHDAASQTQSAGGDKIQAALPSAGPAACSTHAVPDIPEAALPDKPASAPGSVARATPGGRTPSIGLATPRQSLTSLGYLPSPCPMPAGCSQSPVGSSSKGQARRLSFGLEGPHPSGQDQGDHSQKADSTGAGTQHKQDRLSAQLAARLMEQSMSGLLPVSLSALQAVSDYEHRHKAMMSKEVVAMREHNHVLAVLPQLFDKVRALFGAAGPSTRNFEQVAQALASTRGNCQEPSAVAVQLRELAKAAPNFLTIEPAREGSGTIVRLNRRADVRAIRQHLACAAARRHMRASPGAAR